MQREYAIGLGSNLKDRLGNLRQARARLDDWSGGRLTESAPVYETRPLDVPPAFEGYWFLNSVVLIETAVPPEGVLELTQSIERDLGRDRAHEARNGPRTIDLDIIYAGLEMIDRPGIHVPHPRWQQRAFVLQPLADLRPELVLPGVDRPVRLLLANSDSDTVRRVAECPWW